MRITRKITLGYAFITVLMLLICAYAVYSSYRHDRLLHALMETDYQRLAVTDGMLDSFIAEVRNDGKALILKDKDIFIKLSETAADAFNENLKRLKSAAATETDKALLDELSALHVSYGSFMRLAIRGEEAAYRERLSFLEDDITKRIKHYQSLSRQLLEERAAESGRLVKENSWKIILLFAMSTLLGITTAVFSARSINKPLEQLNEGVARISRGCFNEKIALARQDELGGLAHSFNVMTERLRELDQLKADFVSYVSHELRTPLTSLSEANNLLLEEIAGKITAEQKELLLLVREDTQRLLRMINDLLDLSRMEAGMMPLCIDAVEFGSIVSDSVKSLAPWAAVKEIDLSFNVPSDIMVEVDRDRIIQVLNNLIGNAIKFTPVGGFVRVNTDILDSGDMQIVVEDSGIGIPGEYLATIFDKFHQVNPGSNRQVGSGLGLPIARHIIEGHGGVIMAESTVDSGTSFIFTLPASRVREICHHVE